MNTNQTRIGLLAFTVLLAGPALAQGSADKSSDKSGSDKSASTPASKSAGAASKSADKSADKSSDKKGQASLASQDREFVMKAAQGGHAEVEAGKLASSQGADSSVKQFAEKMVQDHGKANDELAQIAKGKGVEPPTAPDAAHQREAKRMQGLKGAEFDRAYMAAMVKDHDETVKLFQNQAKSGRDPELKAFAEKTLPTLQEHQRMAKEMASSAGKGAGKSESKGAAKSEGKGAAKSAGGSASSSAQH